MFSGFFWSVRWQILDKIRVQMDSYLEEGSPEAVMAVVKTLTAAVPVTTAGLRDYILLLLLLLLLIEFLRLGFKECRG